MAWRTTHRRWRISWPIVTSSAFRRTRLFDPEWFIAHAGRRVPRRQDPFAFYLFAGTSADLQPSAGFDAVGWRRRRRGRRTRHFTELLYPDRDNPLLDYLLSSYR